MFFPPMEMIRRKMFFSSGNDPVKDKPFWYHITCCVKIHFVPHYNNINIFYKYEPILLSPVTEESKLVAQTFIHKAIHVNLTTHQNQAVLCISINICLLIFNQCF